LSKKSLDLIFEAFPQIEKGFGKSESLQVNEGSDPILFTFYKLALFFQEPKNNDFDMRLVYLHLQDDWLSFAFECLETFFKEDTFSLSKDYSSIIKEAEDPLLNQTGFSDILESKGFDIDRKKLNVYYKRDKLPTPDRIISGLPFWYLSTVLRFAENTDIKKKETNGEY